MERKIKVFEMFAGYGGASFALKKSGIEHNIVGFSEIDKFAIQCYQQNHIIGCGWTGKHYEETGERCTKYNLCPDCKNKNFGDCTKIDPKELPDFDLLTGGFPCQSFSNAGKGLGELDTRGTLFNEIIRIAEAKQPKYMLLENVKGLMSKRHKETFDKILEELDRIGYHVKVKCLNSKNFGIPQNRERVWFVCYRDVKDWSNHTWPKEEELKIYLKDILEDEVDKKYYLKEEKVLQLIKKLPREIGINATITPDRINKRQNGRRFKEDGEPMFTLNTQDRHGILQLNNPKHSNDRVYSKEGISSTLNTIQGGNRQPFIQIKNATKKGFLKAYEGDGVNLEHPNSKTRRGRIQKDVMGCLQTNDQRGVILEDYKIRKLTPKECFRLMGFLDDEINTEGISNSQQYKLAGNGWDINLVSKIFLKWFKNN